MKRFRKTKWLHFSKDVVPFSYLAIFIIAFPLPATAHDKAQLGTGNPLLALETTGSIPIGKKELSETVTQGLVENGTVTQDPQGEKSHQDQANDDLDGPGVFIPEQTTQPAADEVTKDAAEEPLALDPTEMVKDGILKEVTPPALLEKSAGGIAPHEEVNATTDSVDAAGSAGELAGHNDLTKKPVVP